MIALLYKRLIQLGKVAGACTFLFGIPYGVWQYADAQKGKQVEQSLKLFEKYNSSPFTDYRMKISDAVTKNRVKLIGAAADQQAYEKAIIEIIDVSNIESSLWLVMDFFDGVTICVLSEICDSKTVGQLFPERARDLFLPFYQYIAVQRQTSSATFGYGLEFVATNGRSRIK